jgi:hypothetical protein
MKKYIATFLILLFVGAFSLAQGTKTTLFDVTKSQQELEIMKQILGTTMSFVSQNLQKQQAATKGVNTPFGVYFRGDSIRSSNMNAFYLYGQGAVFVIPASSLRFSNTVFPGGGFNFSTGRDFELAAAELDASARDMAMKALEMQQEAATVSAGVGKGVGKGTGQASASSAPVVAQTKAAQAVNQEELRKRVAEAQDRVKKSREDMEANRAKFLASLGEVKGFLIEALATHGDSLSTVKPNEYITLVILTDDSWDVAALSEGGMRTHQEIVSVQKSWITDYKAGRLTLDAFKQKAIQYAQ